MALEDITAGSTIANLITTNPADGDDIAQGDDHLRNLKKALQYTFPNVSATVSGVASELAFAHKGGTVSGSAAFLSTVTVSGAVTALSTLTASGALVAKTSLTVEGTATVSGALTAKTSLSVEGAATVSAALIAKTSLNVQGTATVSGTLVSLTKIIANALSVSATASLHATSAAFAVSAGFAASASFAHSAQHATSADQAAAVGGLQLFAGEIDSGGTAISLPSGWTATTSGSGNYKILTGLANAVRVLATPNVALTTNVSVTQNVAGQFTVNTYEVTGGGFQPARFYFLAIL